MVKQYDQAYFDRWYRDDKYAAWRGALTAQKAALAVACAEYYLGRAVRSVLDVGCGEGIWRGAVKKLRPRAYYLGLDSSEYAVRRYGRSRNLRLVDFAQLAELRFDRSFDLLVCSDVMHYLPDRALKRGLSGFAELCHGLAYLDVFCADDATEGDHDGFIARPAAKYLRMFRVAGFVPVGGHCYLAPPLHDQAVSLEFGSLVPRRRR